MGKPTVQFDEHTDEATKTMVLALVKKKSKLTKMENIHFLITASVWIFAFVCLFGVRKMAAVEEGAPFAELLMKSVQEPLVQLAFLVGAFLIGAMKITFERKEKADTEYHGLRAEIIDRSKDLWKDKAWEDRHLLYEKMKKDFDINLYHESK